MKKNWLVGMGIVGIIIIGIVIGIAVFEQTNQKQEIGKIDPVEKEGIEDECTAIQKLYEMGLLENLENSEQTSSSDEIISPNAKILIKKNYAGCGHITKEYAEIPSEVVNFTQDQLQQYYQEWDVEKFSKDDIVISKEEAGSCKEHYVVRSLNGFVTVYYLDENNKEVLSFQTDVSTTYLPETDLNALNEGIRINGKDALNSVLEDFE